MRRSIRRLSAVLLLSLALAFGYSYSPTVNLWPVLFDQLASGPGGGGNGGGGGG